jgi:hypothetical protein
MIVAITNEMIPAALARPGDQSGKTAWRQDGLLSVNRTRAIPPLPIVVFIFGIAGERPAVSQ